MNAYTPALVLLAVSLLTAGGCGGKLEDPQRFADIIKRTDAGGSADAGGGNDKGDAAVNPGKDSGANATEPPMCVTTLFSKTCGAVAGCHDKTSTFVDLVSPGVTDRLLDKDSTSDMCKGKTYIATDSNPSLLLQKVSAMPPCGSRMPLGGMLTTAQTKCLTDWVESLGGTAGGT